MSANHSNKRMQWLEFLLQCSTSKKIRMCQGGLFAKVSRAKDACLYLGRLPFNGSFGFVILMFGTN